MPIFRALAAFGAGLLVGPSLVFAPAQASSPSAPSVEPVLVTSVDVSAGGTGARFLLGDVSGDGRLDLVTMQPTYSADDRYIGRQVQALTAYDLNGDRLWQVGTPDPRVTNNGTDIPAEIYDIDADGDNDVLAVMDDEFRIFDGATGALWRSFPLPHPEAHDTIVIANFRGTPTPQDILLKDRYHNVWALDDTGRLLWTHAGNTGHRPYPHDFTGDGRQELIAGYDILSPDGQVLWTAPMADHADSIGVGDVDGDGVEDIALGGAGLGGGSTNVYRADGTPLYSNPDAVEAQQVALGDFRPDLPGLELAGLDRVDRTATTGKDGLYVVSSAGATLWQERRTTLGCWGTVMEPLHNWDGTYRDHMLVWNRGCGEPAGIFDGTGARIATFPVDGRMVRGDLCGDDRTEVVDYVMGDRAYVYGTGPCDLTAKVTGRPLPQSKRLYNYSRYTAEERPAALGTGRGSHRIDLGAIREVTGLRIDRAPKGRMLVETSKDGRRWTKVHSGPATPRLLVTAQARYVRVTLRHPARVTVLGTR